MSPTYSRVMCCDLKRRFSPALWIWTLGSHRKTAIVGYPAHIKSCGFTVVTKQFVLHTIPGKMRGDAIVLSFSTERTAILTKGTFKISKETMKTKKEGKSLKVLTNNPNFRTSIIPTLKYEPPFYSLSNFKEYYRLIF